MPITLRKETNLYDDSAIANMRQALTTKIESTYGTCATAASTVAKVVTLSGFSLFKGAQISVYFSYANTASSPTLNVNGTGAKAIWARGAAIVPQFYWSAKSTQIFTYDGTHWVMDSAESQEEAYKRLTNNGVNTGLYLSNGSLYINASYIHTGTLSANYIYGGTLNLGGSANGVGGNGVLNVYNASGTLIGKWDKNGISVLSGSINGATVTVGGNNNSSGTIIVKNASGVTIGKWDKDGIVVKTGSINGSLITAGKITSQNGLAYFDLDNNILQCTTLRSSSTTSMSGTDLGNFVMDFKTKTASGSRRVYASLYNSKYPGNSIAFWTPDDSRVGYGTSFISTTANSLLLCAKTDKWYGNFPAISIVGNDAIVLAGPATTSDGLGTSITYQVTNSGHSFSGNGNLSGTWKLNGSNIATTSASRYKHNISHKINESLDPHKLYLLQMKQFVYNDGKEQYHDTKDMLLPGFIAEDIAEIYPAAVIHDEDGNIESWDERRIIPGMLKLIQEQHEEIEKLKQIIHIA